MTNQYHSLSPLTQETALLAGGIAAVAQSRNCSVEAVLANYQALQASTIEVEVAGLDIDMDIEVTV